MVLVGVRLVENMGICYIGITWVYGDYTKLYIHIYTQRDYTGITFPYYSLLSTGK